MTTPARELCWQGCPTTMRRELLEHYARLGIPEVRLITKHFWRDLENEVDPDALARSLTQGLAQGCQRATPFIPYDFDGWLWVDIEHPWWMPLRRPEDYTNKECADAVRIFVEVCLCLRELRPNARLALWNMTGVDTDHPRWWCLRAIHAMVDAVSPTLYRYNHHSADSQARVTREYVRRAYALSEQLNIPVIGGIYRRVVGGGWLDAGEARDWLERWNGKTSMDGWFIFAADNAGSIDGFGPDDFATLAKELLA